MSPTPFPAEGSSFDRLAQLSRDDKRMDCVPGLTFRKNGAYDLPVMTKRLSILVIEIRRIIGPALA